MDGLDEAKGWSPGPYLFPKVLPQDVQIVFSARAESDYEASQWFSKLGLDRSRVNVLRLSALSEAAVAKLLEAAGGHATSLSKNSKFVHGLTEVSKGDPFYLHFLVKDVMQALITPKTISQQPSGLQSYLDLWKTQLFEDVDIKKDEVDALLGLLSAALGPLKPAELSAASPALKKGLLLESELRGQCVVTFRAAERAGTHLVIRGSGTISRIMSLVKKSYRSIDSFFSIAAADGARTRVNMR